MTDNSVDPYVFTELQEAMGAEFVDELVTTFLDEAPSMMIEAKTAFEQGDADRFRRAAHSIKSNANVFGASRLAEAARLLELSDVGDASRAMFDVLDVEYDNATASLRDLLHG